MTLEDFLAEWVDGITSTTGMTAEQAWGFIASFAAQQAVKAGEETP